MEFPPFVDAEYRKEIEKARRDLRAVIYDKTCAPIMLRLAWHDAMTFDVDTKIGGPNGSIRNKEELNHAANVGLSFAVDLCEDVMFNHPKITYADLYQLAGVVAVEVLGGPTIEFVPGRKDSLVSPKEGNLPDAKQGNEHLKDVYNRMGLSGGDIVALSGAYNLMERAERSGRSEQFDNSYFWELLEKKRLPTDNETLLDDPGFRTFVQIYAEDRIPFFTHYSSVHKRLSELGFAPTARWERWTSPYPS